MPAAGGRTLRGQTSLELLVTVGVVVAFTLPVIFLLLSVSSVGYEDTAKAQADASGRTLADAMNAVYAQGPGAQRELMLNVPPSTEAVYAADGEAVVRIKTAGGSFDAASPTIAKIGPLSESIEDKRGLFKVVVRANSNGEVEIDDPATP
ncbi:MAG: hypothetical protein AB1529_05915 [Candidatus Micrarchaeota archaeon]